MEINGKKVVDATKKIKINITALDVKHGNNKDPGGCAAARALLRDVPECTKARVHVGRIYLEVGNKWLRFQTPPALRTEIIAFDRGATFTPDEYTIAPLCESRRERVGQMQGSTTGQRTAATTNAGRKKIRVARIKHHMVSGVRHGLVR
jgi:hypothetical protein